ncbi:MAG: hypothetical protein LBG68_04645 [Coriobacteriales bacterium]|jgi:hypothetical protein|nr:hypothetical protein [Coriobacteriales bacterium]
MPVSAPSPKRKRGRPAKEEKYVQVTVRIRPDQLYNLKSFILNRHPLSTLDSVSAVLRELIDNNIPPADRVWM